MNLALLFASLFLTPPPAPQVYNGRLHHLEVLAATTITGKVAGSSGRPADS